MAGKVAAIVDSLQATEGSIATAQVESRLGMLLLCVEPISPAMWRAARDQ